MNSKNIEDYKKTLSLTDIQRELIVGLLLGDGHLETQNNGKTYRLRVEQGSKQKEFVNWLYNEFKAWTNQKPKARESGGWTRYGFTTYSHGSLRFYGHQFYPAGKKVIPKLINKLLTPAAIAVWFMGDGSWKSSRHKTFIIHTLGFSKRDLERVRVVLENKFSVRSSLHKQKDKNWRLYILSESADQFRKLIEPYIIPSMRYKLGNINA